MRSDDDCRECGSEYIVDWAEGVAGAPGAMCPRCYLCDFHLYSDDRNSVLLHGRAVDIVLHGAGRAPAPAPVEADEGDEGEEYVPADVLILGRYRRFQAREVYYPSYPKEFLGVYVLGLLNDAPANYVAPRVGEFDCFQGWEPIAAFDWEDRAGADALLGEIFEAIGAGLPSLWIEGAKI